MGRDELFEVVTTISLELTDLLRVETDVLYIDEEFSQAHAVLQRHRPRHPRVHEELYPLRGQEVLRDLPDGDFSIFGTRWQAEILEKRLEKLNA